MSSDSNLFGVINFLLAVVYQLYKKFKKLIILLLFFWLQLEELIVQLEKNR